MKLRNLLLALTIVLGIASCSKKSDPTPTPTPTPTPPVVVTPYVPDNSFKIVAYMPSYKDPSTVDVSKYKMITHLFYAFANIAGSDGSLVPFTNTEATRFAAVMNTAKSNNVKFGISISGSSTIFADMAKTPINRTNFIKNVVTFANTYNLAGVDIDWEYPSTTVGIESSHNFTLLMIELSNELHKVNRFLSAAVTPGVYAGGVRGGVELEVFPYVDFFNIMQYDGAGYDTAEPLNHASYKMTVASLDYWLGTRLLAKEKAVLGMPLYGKDNSSPVKSIGYRDIEASGADVNLNIATVGGIAYGYNGIPLIKQKTQLAKERCNGIMFWEFAHDSNTAKSLIRAANDQLGRSYN